MVRESFGAGKDADYKSVSVKSQPDFIIRRYVSEATLPVNYDLMLNIGTYLVLVSGLSTAGPVPVSGAPIIASFLARAFKMRRYHYHTVKTPLTYMEFLSPIQRIGRMSLLLFQHPSDARRYT
jgi:hypothetical protein